MMDLLPAGKIREKGVRLLGVTMSNFGEDKPSTAKQLELGFF